MADVLLTLIMPNDIARHVEDLLLSRPDLVNGFTASAAEGHGSSSSLVEAEELVSGHVHRTQIQTIGSESDVRAVLALIKKELPRARIFFWLQNVLEAGHL